jgi:hypothetical protein
MFSLENYSIYLHNLLQLKHNIWAIQRPTLDMSRDGCQVRLYLYYIILYSSFEKFSVAQF